MPLTPFHFGPGLLVKGLAPTRFSWTAFIAVQIPIDCETVYNLVRHNYPVHTQLHTFLGATLVGAATAASLLGARRLAPALARRAKKWGPSLRSECSTMGIVVGAVAGGASHPLLDGLMHGDIRPFAPWTDANPLWGLVGFGALHLGCLAAGITGAVLIRMRLSREV